jgi:hypothetical protein
MKIDGLVKNLKRHISVIPVKAGIQVFQTFKNSWTPVSTGVTTFYDSVEIVGGKSFILQFALCILH